MNSQMSTERHVYCTYRPAGRICRHNRYRYIFAQKRIRQKKASRTDRADRYCTSNRPSIYKNIKKTL